MLGMVLDDDGLLSLHGDSRLNGFTAPGTADALKLAASSFIGNNLVSVDSKKQKKRDLPNEKLKLFTPTA